jgi:O-antigen/teichoic acid export membrane protein
VAGSLAFGRQALLMFYGPEYADTANVLNWLFAVGVLEYVCTNLGHAMASARLFAIQPPVLGLRSIVTVIACFAMIPPFGLKGAAWALGTGLLTQILLYTVALQRALRQKRTARGDVI